MVILNQSAVGANRNVDSSGFVITVALGSHVDNSGSLSSSDTFLFAGNADRAATDTHFYEIGTSLGKIAETFGIYHVASTYFNSVAIIFANPFDSVFLPF